MRPPALPLPTWPGSASPVPSAGRQVRAQDPCHSCDPDPPASPRPHALPSCLPPLMASGWARVHLPCPCGKPSSALESCACGGQGSPPWGGDRWLGPPHGSPDSDAGAEILQDGGPGVWGAQAARDRFFGGSPGHLGPTPCSRRREGSFPGAGPAGGRLVLGSEHLLLHAGPKPLATPYLQALRGRLPHLPAAGLGTGDAGKTLSMGAGRVGGGRGCGPASHLGWASAGGASRSRRPPRGGLSGLRARRGGAALGGRQLVGTAARRLSWRSCERTAQLRPGPRAHAAQFPSFVWM